MDVMRKIVLALPVVAAVALIVANSFGNRDREALCGGIRYELVRVGNGASPYVELSADGVSGHFLLDFGATTSSLSARVFATSTESVKNVKLSLPGFNHGLFELKRYDLPVDVQLGVIGTDFLSRLSVQITDNAVFLGEQPCQKATMRSHGFVPIDQERFFSSDPSAIDARLPNVPIIFCVWVRLDFGLK
jgi:hypothetical protein